MYFQLVFSKSLFQCESEKGLQLAEAIQAVFEQIFPLTMQMESEQKF